MNTTNLHHMLLIEIAASDWFAKMNKREQKAYIASHPRSKYARRAPGVDATKSTAPSVKKSRVLSKKFGNIANRHLDASSRHDQLYDKHKVAGNSERAAHHRSMSRLHMKASDHYNKVSAHYDNGKHASAEKSLVTARDHNQRAKDANAAFKSGHGTAKTTVKKAASKAVKEVRGEGILKRAAKSRSDQSGGEKIGHFTKAPEVTLHRVKGRDASGKPVHHVDIRAPGQKTQRIVKNVSALLSHQKLKAHLKNLHGKLFGKSGGVTWHGEDGAKPKKSRSTPVTEQKTPKPQAFDPDENVRRYHDSLHKSANDHTDMVKAHEREAGLESSTPKRNLHLKAAAHHRDAAQHYRIAHKAYGEGDNKTGAEASRLATTHRRDALRASKSAREHGQPKEGD